jgi:hypothetical protein
MKVPRKFSRGTAYVLTASGIALAILMVVNSNLNDKQAATAIDLNNAPALDSRYGTDATAECGIRADEYLRSVSRYDFKWDDVGFLGSKFDKYLEETSKPGVLTLASNKAAIQNAFGAYQRITIFCDFDTQAGRVLEYRIVDQ